MSNKPNLKKPGPPPTAPASSPDAWWSHPLVWIGGLVVVALAVTVALNVGGGDDGDVVSTDDAGTAESVVETAFAEILGPPLAPLDGDDGTVGTPAPRISAQNFDGSRVQIGGDGTARLYGFFAHWCPHCQDEIPRVTEWLNDNELPAGVEVVAISTGVSSDLDNYPPSAWFEREQWPVTVVIDDAESPLAQGFGLTAFPFWVAVDADGNVARRVTGGLPIDDFEALVALIDPANPATG